MNIVDRFLKYVSFCTTSDENTGKTPSTPGQMVFARYLADELKAIGMTDVSLDENGYIMATLEANDQQPMTNDQRPIIGFIAHMDTSPDASGENVKTSVVKAEERDFIDARYAGQDVIVTDNKTLLGADDKAGIAEIVTAMEYLIAHPEFENFNAAACKIHIHGLNVHPGYGYQKMRNSMLIANELAAMLPANETPAHTQGYEGFYHLVGMQGTVEESTLSYIIRDHDRARFEARKQFIETVVARINELYGAGTAEAEIRDQYYNMREKIEPVMHIIDLAQEAMKAVGVTPVVKPIRGGTDGARLSFEGLPCPNIFAGGENFHSRYEYLPIRSLEAAQGVIIEIVKLLNR